MNGNEYQKLAMRINDGKAKERLDDELYYGVKISTPELLNGVLGLTEVVDLVKKGIFHENGIDKGHLKKELGDVMWYVTMICDSCGFELNDVMNTNIEKLRTRFPNSFETILANNRKEGDV